jgi:hypothetical protein
MQHGAKPKSSTLTLWFACQAEYPFYTLLS